MTQVVRSRSKRPFLSRASIVCGVLAAALLVGCSNDDNDNDVVTTRSNATADFTSYKTFAFPDPSQANPAVVAAIPSDVKTDLQQVNDAVRQQLLDQGLTEVDPTANPDLVAVSLASTQDHAGYTWSCVDGYWWGYWTYTYNPCAWLEPVYTEFTTGSVAVLLVDPAMQEAVFGGVMKSVLEGNSQSDIDQNIDNGVAQIFESYPANQTGSGS
ncbi:MAG: DUF4136 domain-containing protein [Myxococcales bacterium]